MLCGYAVVMGCDWVPGRELSTHNPNRPCSNTAHRLGIEVSNAYGPAVVSVDVVRNAN